MVVRLNLCIKNFMKPWNITWISLLSFFRISNKSVIRLNSPPLILCKYTALIGFTGPFMPCRDLFDWWMLRCGVWIVFLLALLGNGTVVVVLVFARSKMDVPRFLVANLAFADFFMGIYLGNYYYSYYYQNNIFFW